MYTQNRGLFFLFGYIIFVSWLDAGTISNPANSFGWSGGGWGPRYLIPILPFITIASGTLFLNLRKMHFKSALLLKVSIIILCIAGFYVSLVGKLIWVMYGYSYAISEKGLSRISHIDSGSILIWIPYYSPIVLHTEALTSNFPSHIKLNPVATAFGNAPCSYDIYLLCKFGIIPVLLS